MSRRTAAWVAWSVCTVSLLIMALGLLVVFFGWSTPLPPGWYPWAYWPTTSSWPSVHHYWAGSSPRSDPRTLRMVVARHGHGLRSCDFAPVYAAYALVVAPGSLPAPRTLASLGQSEGYAAIIILAPFLFLLFPNGRLPSRRWRLLAWSIVAVGAVMVILAPFLAYQPGS